MKNLTLEHISQACHGIYQGSEEAREKCITAVTTDSRKVEPGCLFVPIVGARADGHHFISQVMEAGALCTLSEKNLGEKPRSFDDYLITVEELPGGVVPEIIDLM